MFEQAMSTAPLTLPAHCSLFTGLFPPHHGVRDNVDPPLAESYTTVAEVLRENSVRSASVRRLGGRWRTSRAGAGIRHLFRWSTRAAEQAETPGRRRRRRGHRLDHPSRRVTVLHLGAPLRRACTLHAARAVPDDVRRRAVSGCDRVHGRADRTSVEGHLNSVIVWTRRLSWSLVTTANLLANMARTPTASSSTRALSGFR